MDWDISSGFIIAGIFIIFLLIILIFIMTSGKRRATVSREQPNIQEFLPIRNDNELDEETIAVISAAVACIMEAKGKPFRIKSVQRVFTARPAWAAAGIYENTQPF